MFRAAPPAQPIDRDVFHGFAAHSGSWESFIIWLVDPFKPTGPGNGPPLHPDWPIAPANAIAPSLISLPIRYNSTVVLQSLQTGICSPILTVRRIEQDAEAVGGDGTFSEAMRCCPGGELLGDLVSQLQKIAFEVYKSDTMILASSNSRYGGLWLSCDEDAAKERFVQRERRWTPMSAAQKKGSRPSSVPSTPNQRYGVLPMTPHTGSANLPSTPSSPVSNGSSLDHFGSHSRRTSSSSLKSPKSVEAVLPSNDGGPVRRRRTGSTSRYPLDRPMHTKRRSADGSASSSFAHLANSSQPSSVPASHANVSRYSWSLYVGDVCIWTIVSTDQVTYTFYVPPYITDIKEPIAPFPSVSRLLRANTAVDMGPGSTNLHQTFTSRTEAPLVTM